MELLSWKQKWNGEPRGVAHFDMSEFPLIDDWVYHWSVVGLVGPKDSWFTTQADQTVGWATEPMELDEYWKLIFRLIILCQISHANYSILSIIIVECVLNWNLTQTGNSAIMWEVYLMTSADLRHQSSSCCQFYCWALFFMFVFFLCGSFSGLLASHTFLVCSAR